MTEDLNIARNTFKIVEYCWYNKKRFKTVEDISNVTKISVKTLSRIASDNHLPFRYLIHKDATDKESAQARTKV